MAYFNPFMGMIPNQQSPTQFAAASPQNGQGRARAPIDVQQFRQFAITLNDSALNNFAQMARAQGISEQDIASGIQFIKSL